MHCSSVKNKELTIKDKAKENKNKHILIINELLSSFGIIDDIKG